MQGCILQSVAGAAQEELLRSRGEGPLALPLLRRLCGWAWGRARRPLGAQLRGDQELWHLRDGLERPVPKDGRPEEEAERLPRKPCER